MAKITEKHRHEQLARIQRAIDEFYYNTYGFGELGIACEKAFEALIEKERGGNNKVRGRWEWNSDNGYYYCSNCNAVSPREDQEGEYCDTPAFCHVCGADMREVDDED